MKKNRKILGRAIIAVALISCKKENNNATSITGKWQEVKLNTYVQSQTGAITGDTTYTGLSFKNLDYARFYAGDTCVIATDRYFNPAGEPSIFPNEFISMKFKYAQAGSLFPIKQIVFSPGGYFTADTATLISQNSLLIHSVSYVAVPTYLTISDAYYTRLP